VPPTPKICKIILIFKTVPFVAVTLFPALKIASACRENENHNDGG
jgi:hypothetical protein